MRLRLLREDNGVSKFVDYQRSRMRVARATVFNLLLLGPVLVFFLIRQADAAPSVIAGTAVAAVLATVGAYMAYRRTESAYIRILSHAYRVAEGIPQAEIAAAVCYRWRDGELEFCVVQTEDGKRWTFPKGHREEDETLPEAARREAREEAGITGPVDGQRLHTYRYPPSREGLTDDDVVAAYLLKVKGTTVPKEDRTPHWCGIDELRRKLAQRRLRRYVVEIDPVINAAARAAATRKPGRSRRIRTGGSWVQVSEN
jgi:8-oxo-dGTP pyrophosphatase MutT (NUDIX family)